MTMDRRKFMVMAAGAAALLPIAANAAGKSASAGKMGIEDMQKKLKSVYGVDIVGNEQIAMLLYPGMTALDMMGPYHFLASMPGARTHLVTTQSDLRPVASDIGLALQPTTTMADCPNDLTLLFVPGGTAGTLAVARDKTALAFVRDRGLRAQHITSVCTGSLILGAAGLLRGKRATSHWSVVDNLAQFGATPVRERVVKDGNVTTGAGVSAGLDFGVSVLADLRGKPFAEAAVLMSEYAPEPPIRGGTPASARGEILDVASLMLDPFVTEVKGLGIAG